ncbi:MAG: universal stress protein [Deltaproteobacteria bacterium]|nr:universal stress protein [Deltaproteobacteria bacterium]
MSMKIVRILAPIDFSEGSRKAVEYALELGRRYEAEIDLLYVWTPEAYVIPEMSGAVASSMAYASDYGAEAAWKNDMETFRASLDTRGLQVHGRVECGHPAETIVKVAQESDYGLIVMGTHGRTGLQHVLIGSVAERVVRLAHCPVLSVPLAVRPRQEGGR